MSNGALHRWSHNSAIDSVESLVGQVADEFTERLNRGEQPAVEEYALRYPEIADLLRQALPALQAMVPSGEVTAPSAAPANREQPLAGRLGDFCILREIGRGGMGIVYEAEQISLGRRVALKVLPFAAALDPKQLQRFKNEAQAAAQLHHTNIVPVFGVGCERGVHYYAMQFIEGQTLAAVITELRQHNGIEPRDPNHLLSEVAQELASGRLAPAKRREGALEDRPDREEPTGPYHAATAPPYRASTSQQPDSTLPAAALSGEGSIKSAAYFRTVANLGLQAADALEHAHQLGVVHRDIKPANLLVDVRGNLWITDFGLAHFQSNPGLTLSGDLVGTLRYMSPEQALAKRVLIDQRTDIYSLGVTLYELLTLEQAFSGRDREELLRQIAFEEPRSPRRLNKPIPAELETIVLKAMEKNPAERYATAQELADDLRRYLEDKPIHAKRPTLAQRAIKWGRRHRPAVWAAVVLLVAAMFGSVVATLVIARERDVAQANLEQANKNLRLAFLILDNLCKTLEGKGFWNEAIDARKEFIQLNPGIGAAYFHLGLAFYRQGTLDEAIAALREAARLEPNFAVAHLLLGDALVDKGALDEAIAAYTKATHLNPNNWGGHDSLGLGIGMVGGVAAAHNRLGLVLQKKAALNEAITAFQEAVRLDPNLACFRCNLALAFADKGDHGEASAVCKEALERMPDNADLHNTLAIVLWKKGATDEAITAYKQAVRLKEDNAVCRYDLLAFLVQKGLLDEAIAANKDALRIKPQDASLYDQLGVALYKKGADEEALSAAGEAIRLKPSNPYYHAYLGAILLDMGALDKAIAAFRKAIRIQPENAFAYSELGYALVEKGFLDEALDAHKEGLRLKPNNASFHNLVGITYLRRDELNEAVASFRESTRLQPDGPKAFVNLSQALLAKRALSEAEKILQKVAVLLQKEDNPRQRAIYLTRLAELHRDTARPREAEKELRQAQNILEESAATSPKDRDVPDRLAEILSARALFCRDRGDLAEARRLFGEAIEQQKKALELGSKTLPHYEGRLGIYSLQLADTLLHLPEAPGLTEQVDGLLREAVRCSTDDRSGQNALAWFLATCPEARLHDPKRAVELAERLVEQGPQRPAYWRTLGAARYGVGDWQGAFAALEKAQQLSNGGDGTERFFVAMASWRMGKKEAARASYEEAVQWLEKYKAQPDEWRRFRTEAAALLGIHEQPLQKQPTVGKEQAAERSATPQRAN
jgi:tetratricopeptide (TPR) repeat protein